MSEFRPNVVIIAGPNGSGKSTTARSLILDLLDIAEFVNADTIAAGLSAYDVDAVALEAGRIMLERLNDLARNGDDFAFETTLASRTFARSIQVWKQQGYRVQLLFLWLASPELAKARVRSRVLEGGHDIPMDVIERRYWRGLQNFHNLYRPIVDRWQVYDNSSKSPTLIASGAVASEAVIIDSSIWRLIQEQHND